jgi:hypothetical protein
MWKNAVRQRNISAFNKHKKIVEWSFFCSAVCSRLKAGLTDWLLIFDKNRKRFFICGNWFPLKQRKTRTIVNLIAQV